MTFFFRTGALQDHLFEFEKVVEQQLRCLSQTMPPRKRKGKISAKQTELQQDPASFLDGQSESGGGGPAGKCLL